MFLLLKKVIPLVKWEIFLQSTQCINSGKSGHTSGDGENLDLFWIRNWSPNRLQVMGPDPKISIAAVGEES